MKPSSKNAPGKKGSCLSEIQRMQREREERRRAMEEKRLNRAAEEKKYRENGNLGDVDFQRMIIDYREDSGLTEQPHSTASDMKICICARKRPINSKEVKRKDHDSVTVCNPVVTVHDCKFRVDGITKYLDNSSFELDHTFHEDDTTEDVYMYTAQPLVEFVLSGGRATVFAYGQTGSGKTFTMVGIQKFIAEDLFHLLTNTEDASLSDLQVMVSFFEIYGGRCQDLLNHRHRLVIREDGSGEVVVAGLEEVPAESAEEMLSVIELGNRNRTTHATESNDESSRSHAICQIVLRQRRSGKQVGKLSLIDLAGSERGADTKSHNRQRRMEGAEINKSLLALKECIRALDNPNANHVPYRASKLTLVLKDSFTNKRTRTVMIVNISPAASCADHTLNTLRYADRVKERVVGEAAAAAANNNNNVAPSRIAAIAGGVGAKDVRQPSAAAKAAAPVQQRSEAKNGGANGAVRGNVKVAESKLQEEEEEAEDELVEDLHRTVEGLFEEEEELLNLHMSIIQENAELLTEEGRLLQMIQGEDVVDYDIDGYAKRLDDILQRKQELITLLQSKLSAFRSHLQKEELMSSKVHHMRLY